MNSNTLKAKRFFNAIQSDADARCGEIKKEVDRYVEKELTTARRLARQNVRQVKSSELDRLNEEINAELSETETKETEKLVMRRSEITEKVFAEALAKITDFTKSEKYLGFLLSSASEIRAAAGEDTVIILRPDDKKYEADIKALGSEVRYDETIRLGGCKGENLRTALLADDTLDSRIAEEKQRFYSYSGLSLSL